MPTLIIISSVPCERLFLFSLSVFMQVCCSVSVFQIVVYTYQMPLIDKFCSCTYIGVLVICLLCYYKVSLGIRLLSEAICSSMCVSAHKRRQSYCLEKLILYDGGTLAAQCL